MPIEIRELVIRATVDAGEERPERRSASESSDRTELVEQCVEQVLEILRKQGER